jgi:adenylylsulfate reductase subunit B
MQEEAMPTYVDPHACNACAGVDAGPLCVYICPNDLMVLDPGSNKGFNQEAEMCSECYACVKLCPQNAIHVRGYADFVPLGGEVQPSYVDGEIQWDVTFRDGRKKQFRFPVRTTPEGSANAHEGLSDADMSLLRTPLLFGEPGNLEVSKVPTWHR